MLETPVLFLVFNRPDTTTLVFNAIREAKPVNLFIAADGPREGNEKDIFNCKQVLEIIEDIDWPCEVKTLLRKKNLGCKLAVSSAIDWFFENVEEGIILEDDCLPDQSFFTFCEKLLNYYRDNERIMHISGDNFLFNKRKINESYYYSNLNHIWGWATWKSAWKHYDVTMSAFPKFLEDGMLLKFLRDQSQFNYWKNIFEKVYLGKLDTWDLQWTFSIWLNKGISILPNKNLVSNVGFGPEATHTIDFNGMANIPVHNITEIIHPKKIKVDYMADNLFYNEYIYQDNMIRSGFRKSYNKLKTVIAYLKSFIHIPQMVLEIRDGNNHLLKLVYDLKLRLEIQDEILGKLATENISLKKNKLVESEFKIYSQWGNDGILQYLIAAIGDIPRSFVEFGVENYEEANSRFLLINNNWSGLVIDSSKFNINYIKKQDYYWMHDLIALNEFVDVENINEIFRKVGFTGEIGLLSIDIDGNDYWIWKSIEVVQPVIVVIEYNSVFGLDNAITIPYKKDFFRTDAHYSNLYFGASLLALVMLGEEKGYSFVGSDSAGVNAYFVKNSRINNLIPLTVKEGYVQSKFRQSRDEHGNLTFLNLFEQKELLKGLPVINVMNGILETL